MFNVLVRRATWAQVAGLFNSLATNSLHHVESREGLLYVATDSIGGRTWNASKEAEHTLPSFNGEYLGFAEDSLEEVAFTSATSGARLAGFNTPAGWELEYNGRVKVDSLRSTGSPHREV
jgi:hypothetical protein